MTEYVWVSGKRHLVAMAYLPSIGWFDVTFLDLSTVFPRDRFWLLSFIFLCFFVVVILIVHYLINREIVRPISILSSALQRFSKGEMQSDTLENRHSGELWEIFDQFKNMAALVTDNTARLEAMVEERTRKLEAMAKVDSLTGLLNRNAMTPILKKEADRCSRLHLSFGLIWIDIDNFKDVNDTYGHACGDELLAELATQLKKDLRTYDYAARWGGDEFIVLLSPSDEEQISRVAKRLCMSIGENSLFERYSTTVSTGWALSSGDESFEDVLALADQVLYQTKRQAINVI
jgi:diguanylate cyclase (GGDEF)-like protein